MINKFLKLLKESRHTVFFGGAGVSTESNIPDFRSAKGIYSEKNGLGYRPEEIISATFFYQYPEEFYRFYFNKLIYQNAMPNPAHVVLAKMEEKQLLSSVITQNIDGLHQKAGSVKVVELHGAVQRNFCLECHQEYNLSETLLAYHNNHDNLPLCSCGGLIKPDVVLYEEPLNEKVLETAIAEISRADLLIVGGTSLVVYPAAGLLHYFKGRNVVIINKEDNFYQKSSTLKIRDSIGKVFQQVGELLEF